MGGPFYDAATRYMAPRFASFNTIVQGVIQARLGNPSVTKQHNLSTDPGAVANEVDAAWAKYCYDHKFHDFIDGQPEGGQVAAARPFPAPPPAPRIPGPVRPTLRQSARNVVAGSEILVDWLASGAEAVTPDLSARRASICAACPMNERISSWTDIFTVPVSNAIRGAINLRSEWKLSTPDDQKLGVCNACSCPLPLKVHVPLDRILSKMPNESKDALAEGCWITAENKPT